MIERLRGILPAKIYWRVLEFRGLGHGGPEWKRRLGVIRKVHQDALQQERSGRPTEEIFDNIKRELERQGIAWVESVALDAVEADHEKMIYPREIIAKSPGYDTSLEASGWVVYYEGEAGERDKYPEEFKIELKGGSN